MIRGLLVLVLCVSAASAAEVDLVAKWGQAREMVEAKARAQMVLGAWQSAVRELEVRQAVVERSLVEQIRALAVRLEQADAARRAKAAEKAKAEAEKKAAEDAKAKAQAVVGPQPLVDGKPVGK